MEFGLRPLSHRISCAKGSFVCVAMRRRPPNESLLGWRWPKADAVSLMPSASLALTAPRESDTLALSLGESTHSAPVVNSHYSDSLALRSHCHLESDSLFDLLLPRPSSLSHSFIVPKYKLHPLRRIEAGRSASNGLLVSTTRESSSARPLAALIVASSQRIRRRRQLRFSGIAAAFSPCTR